MDTSYYFIVIHFKLLVVDSVKSAVSAQIGRFVGFVGKQTDRRQHQIIYPTCYREPYPQTIATKLPTSADLNYFRATTPVLALGVGRRGPT